MQIADFFATIGFKLDEQTKEHVNQSFKSITNKIKTISKNASAEIKKIAKDPSLKSLKLKSEEISDIFKNLVIGSAFTYGISKLSHTLLDLTSTTADWANNLDIVESKTGTNILKLQRYAKIAKTAGIDEGAIYSTLERINQKIIDIRAGLGGAGDFVLAGISLDGSPDEIFNRIVEASKTMTAEQTQLLAKLTEVDPHLLQALRLSEPIDFQPYELISEEDIKRAKEQKALITSIEIRIEAIKKKIGVILAPIAEMLRSGLNKALGVTLELLDSIGQSNATKAALGMFLTLAGVVGGTILKAVIKLVPILARVGVILASSIFKPIVALSKALMGLFGLVAPFLGSTLAIVGKISTSILGIATGTVGVLIAKITALSAIVVDLISYITTGTTPILDTITDLIDKKIPAIGDAIREIKNIVIDVVSTAKGLISNAYEFVLNQVFSIYEEIGNKIGGLFGRKPTKTFIGKNTSSVLPDKFESNTANWIKGTFDNLMLDLYRFSSSIHSSVLPQPVTVNKGATGGSNLFNVSNHNNFNISGRDAQEIAQQIERKLGSDSFIKGLEEASRTINQQGS